MLATGRALPSRKKRVSTPKTKRSLSPTFRASISLSPYSPEEIVARDYLLDGGPDAVINLVDATNLERNLYLTSQILNLGVPVVLALNMMDLVEKNGDKIDVDGLSKQLGCPVVPTSALRGRGMEDVVNAAIEAAKAKKVPESQMKFDAVVEEAIAKIEGILGSKVSSSTSRWYAIKLFEGEQKTIDDLKLSASELKAIDEVRDAIENKLDDDAESIVTSERYNAISHVIDKTVKRSRTGLTTSQKIDRVVTNRWLGLPIFIAIMFFVYWLAVTVGTGPVTDWANDGISGDGYLYTGQAAYEEAEGEYEDAQGAVEAYVTSIDGMDEARDVPSDESQEALDALAVAEPEDDADEDAVAEYEDAQATVEDFEEKAEAENAVATVEVEGEDGVTAEEEVDFDAYKEATEIAEPDPADYGLWIPGLGAIIADAMEIGPTLLRGCSRSLTTASLPGVWRGHWLHPADDYSVLAAGHSGAVRLICRASPSSWTVRSASSAFPASRSFLCLSHQAAACLLLWLRRPSKTRWIAA